MRQCGIATRLLLPDAGGPPVTRLASDHLGPVRTPHLSQHRPPRAQVAMDSEVVHGISLSWWRDVTWRALGEGTKGDLGPFLVPNHVIHMILRYFDEVLVWVLNCNLKGIGTEPSFFTVERFYLGDIWDICIKVWSQYVSIFLVEVLVQALSVSPKGSEKQLPAETVGSIGIAFPSTGGNSVKSLSFQWHQFRPRLYAGHVLRRSSHDRHRVAPCCTIIDPLLKILRENQHLQALSIPMYQRSYIWIYVIFLVSFFVFQCFWFLSAMVHCGTPRRMLGTDRSEFGSAADCQRHCASVKGCILSTNCGWYDDT